MPPFIPEPYPLQLGTVVHDVNRLRWVYVGYRMGYVFRVEVSTQTKAWPNYEYSAKQRKTLVNRFPDLVCHWPEEAPS